MNEKAWNKISGDYYSEVLSPLKDCAHNPLVDDLQALRSKKLSVVELGCGLGELVPLLVKNFRSVTSIDFSPDMITQAKAGKSVGDAEFLVMDMADMRGLEGLFDVAVAVNSIISPDLAKLNRMTEEIFSILKPGGRLFAIIPAMESYIYQNMIFVDRELDRKASQKKVIMLASKKLDHKSFDAFHGLIDFEGDVQKAFYRFEIIYRFGRAGFDNFRIQRVPYRWKKWKEAGQMYYPREDPPWDWYFTCRKPK